MRISASSSSDSSEATIKYSAAELTLYTWIGVSFAIRLWLGISERKLALIPVVSHATDRLQAALSV